MPARAVDVAALERGPLLGPEPGRGGERGQRPVARRRELGGDRVELGDACRHGSAAAAAGGSAPASAAGFARAAASARRGERLP